MLTNNDEITLSIDIRYAQGHHQTLWDGATEGLLPGQSTFAALLPVMVSLFNQETGALLSVVPKFEEPPDIRNPQSESFQTIKTAYQQVKGTASPFYAIGGITDARGYPTLVAAGALFSTDFGEPINFHGIYEGAPINDLRLSAQVLYKVLLRTVKD